MISIILADDREIIRESLVSILSKISYLKICGQYSNFYQTIKNVELFQPNLLMLNVLMSGLNINDAIEDISRISPKTRTIAMCLYEGDINISQAVNSRIHAYITKSNTVRDLIEAIKSNVRRERVTYEDSYRKPSINYLQTINSIKICDFYKGVLTPRQQEILKLIAEGIRQKNCLLT